jgi:hypothetical protein
MGIFDRAKDYITSIFDNDDMSGEGNGWGDGGSSSSSSFSSRKKFKKWADYKLYYSWLIPGTPNHLAMKKRLLQKKQMSRWGKFWDFLQIFLSVFGCGMYIAETYSTSYFENQIFNYNEIIITQFFLLDFLFNWYTAINTKVFLSSVMTIVDIITIFPVYVGIITGQELNLSIFRFVRILRLIRVLRTFRLLGDLSGLKRQLITLTLTLLSMSFMAAGVFNVMENQVKQLNYDCKFINENTNYRPSCRSDTNTYDDESCDCLENNCEAAYQRGDENHRPSGITCTSIPFFDCFFYIVVTMSTVGYGDIHPTTSFSRVVVILFIITFAVVIPMQLNQLVRLLSAQSPFRGRYNANATDEHVVLCGHVNDRKKLEKFFKEFFHPDRTLHNSPQFHIVILCPEDPTEEVTSLLVAPYFDSKVKYLIGSALNVEDLQRAQVDLASAVFFLSNIEAKVEAACADGTTTVLRTLAVSDFNPDIQCLVEVLHSHDSEILKNSDVEVVLCVDELKTVMLARNAVCPGLTTLVSNLFRTYGSPLIQGPHFHDHWMREYHQGQCMDCYYIPLSKSLFEAVSFEWSLVVEGIYMEYGALLIGVFDPLSGAISLNPLDIDFRETFETTVYAGILITEDQDYASAISKGISDTQTISRMTTALVEAEAKFGVRVLPKQEGAMQRQQSSKHASGSNDKPRLQDMLTFCKLSRADRKAAQRAKKPLPNKSFLAGGAGGGGGAVYVKNPDQALKLQRKTRPTLGALESFDGHEQEDESKNVGDGGSSTKKPSAILSRFLSAKSKVETPTLVLGQVTHALHLTDHIIVFGCKENMPSFVDFVDIPLVNSLTEGENRSILYVGPELPQKWLKMKQNHPSLFYLHGDMSTKVTLSRTNITKAYSVVMLAHRREELEFEDDDNMDFEMLFLYLKISSYIPSHVHFTIELTSGQNMGVLNSVAVRKESGGVDFQVIEEANSPSVSMDETFILDTDQTGGLFFSPLPSLPFPSLSSSPVLSSPVDLPPCHPDRDLLRAQLREMKSASHRAAKSNLMTKGTFYSQFLKSERNDSNSLQKIEGLLKLTARKRENLPFPTFESVTEVFPLPPPPCALSCLTSLFLCYLLPHSLSVICQHLCVGQSRHALQTRHLRCWKSFRSRCRGQHPLPGPLPPSHCPSSSDLSCPRASSPQ